MGTGPQVHRTTDLEPELMYVTARPLRTGHRSRNITLDAECAFV